MKGDWDNPTQPHGITDPLDTQKQHIQKNWQV